MYRVVIYNESDVIDSEMFNTISEAVRFGEERVYHHDDLWFKIIGENH